MIAILKRCASQSILYGLKNSLKTVLVVTAEFLLSTWNSCDFLISEMDPESLKSDLVSVSILSCVCSFQEGSQHEPDEPMTRRFRINYMYQS